jgi:hypothetical protein
VTEQFLHHANIGAALEQVRRERVPQVVRRHRAADPNRTRPLLEHPGA